MSVAQIALDPLAQAVQLHCSGSLSEAEAMYRKVLERTPRHPKATQFLGVLLFQSDRRSEGMSLLREAIESNPNDAEAWSNLGNALRVQEDRLGAIEALQTAIGLDSRNASAYCTLSACLRHPGSLEESIATARAAIRIQPQMPQAHTNLGLALLDYGDSHAATAAFQQARYLAPRFPEALQGLLFAAHYNDRVTAEEIKTIAEEFAGLSDAVVPTLPKDIMRIGFVSGDFRQHPVAYFVEPLLRGLKDRGIQTVLFSNGSKTDEWTTRLRATSDEFVKIAGVSTADVVQQIRSRDVDVLVDLAGHTANNRWDVFAQRSAPMQVSWLGFSGTTGLPNMDVLIGDCSVTPKGHEHRYTERVVQLQGCVFCFDPARIADEVSPSPHLSTGTVTFGSFNNVSKISPASVALWSSVLKRTPGSTLLLKSFHLAEEGIVGRLTQLFAMNGIEPGRIRTRGWSDEGTQFADYHGVDIALDTFPYSGATTTIEALYMGVPVVTLAGDRYASRMSHSLLAAIGKPEWSNETPDEFVETAVRLATERETLSKTRSSLRSQVLESPLCDAKSFTDDFVMRLCECASPRNQDSRETKYAP